MNLFKLSFMNLKQNLRNYSMYIFSMVFSIVVFYNFLSLMYSKQFMSIKSLNTVAGIASMCSIILIMFFIFFISYSSNFFIEQRKKEFGIYTFMGIENKKIAVLLSQEGLFIGIIALIIGLGAGIICNKLFLMAVVKFSEIDIPMEFEIQTGAIIQTVVVFISILIVVFIKEYLVLIKTDITNLINAKNIYQVEDSKNSNVKGYIGLSIIILGYMMILLFKKFNIPFPIAIILTVLLVILGTIYLFKGFFTFFINKIINNKKILYKKTNLVSYNNIIFRIKNSNKTLAQVAILITCTLTSIVTAMCMKRLIVGGYEIEVPYSLYYFSNTSNDKIVDKAISLSKEKIAYEANLEMIPYEIDSIPYISNINIVKYSDIEHIINNKDLYNETKIIRNKPNKGEGILIIPKNLINAFNFNVKINIGDKDIKINNSVATSILGTLSNDYLLIVNDKYYNEISNTTKVEKINFRGITLENYENTKEISKYIQQNSDMNFFSADKFTSEDYSFMNSVYFIGICLAVVFMISLGSIMYFKCISDASIDKERFSTLRKLGIENEYINKVIYKQVGIFFILPIMIGFLNSIVAGYAVNSLFNESSYLTIVGSILIFSIIYVLYYLITCRKYINITK